MDFLNSYFQSPIFKGLKIDGTLVIQFTLVVILWLILKVLFLDKLKEVLLNRESKTSGLEKQADQTLQRAQLLSEKYKTEIDSTHAKAQTEFTKLKEQIIQREEEKYRKAEAEALSESKRDLHSFNDDFQLRADKVRQDAEGLGQQLLKKLMG